MTNKYVTLVQYTAPNKFTPLIIIDRVGDITDAQFKVVCNSVAGMLEGMCNIKDVRVQECVE
jgi:hypothetical protein